jgi:hypothetical protein
MDEVRFNDVELNFISDALESLWMPENPLDPANSQRAERIRIQRKISKLLDHPKTEFV